MEVKRLFDILDKYKKDYPNQEVALSGKQNGEWKTYSIDEYVETTNLVSFALIELGIQRGEKVAIISSNRPEWNILDMAIMQIGAICVPIYPTISEADYNYIINHCEAKMLVVEGDVVMRKIENIMPEIPKAKMIYTFIDREKFPYFEQLVQLGKENPKPEELQKRKDDTSEYDCSTIMYTSGTTGSPKGVMLSHSNVVQNFLNVSETPSKWSRKAFSFLPLCHAYERMLVFMYQYLGMSVYYAQNLATIAENIKEVNPSMMSAVPRVLEKFYDKIYSSGKKQKGIKKVIFFWAIKLARRYKIEDSERTWWYNKRLKLADKLVYSKIRCNIGGNFDIIVSGAASIQPRLASFFSAIKMPIFEGYGLTETSPVIAVSTRKKHGRESGAVGRPLTGVEVKIAENGEVICRGHNVMMGYYRDEELTKEVIDSDGWLHTGDLGSFNKNGMLIITGRLRNIFKTSFGKFINAQVLEEKFCESAFIENIVVIGENQKFAAALISPDFNFIREWCGYHNIEYTNPQDIIKNEKLIDRFRKEINKYNQFFGDFERIKKYELIADEWSQLTDVLTPTLKVKRKLVIQRYAKLIEKIFA